MQDSVRNWDSAGIGIVSFATALAVATAAGVFVVKELEESLPAFTTVLATLLATVSLLAYLAVVLFGLNALLGEFQARQREQIVRASLAVFAQVYTAVLTAGILIYFPLLESLLQKIP